MLSLKPDRPLDPLLIAVMRQVDSVIKAMRLTYLVCGAVGHATSMHHNGAWDRDFLLKISPGRRGGKGSHRNFVHPKVAKIVTLSGNPGDDVKHYQERAVKTAIEE